MGRELWGQVAAAVVMSMTPFIYGTTLSFGGLLLAESNSAELRRMSIGDAVMIAAASNIGRMAACVLSAQLTDRLGVLRVIQLSTPLNLLAWPLMTLTAGRITILAGSVGAGAVVGLTGLTGRLYIAEVTTSRYRPVLCYLAGVFLGLGILIAFSLSALLPWRYAVLICGTFPSVVQVVGTILLPNSPRWLMNRGFSNELVRKAIVFYRGATTDIGAELKAIHESLRGKSNLNIIKQLHLIFTDWDVGKPCLLMIIQFTFETFCGGVVLNQFAHSVFQSAVQSLSPINCTQIIVALQVAAIAVSGSLLHVFGRRKVLTGAALLTGLGQIVVAAFFQFEDVLGSHQWLVVVGLAVANAASMGGISQLSHLYLGETLPTRVRQMFGSAVSLYMGALSVAFIHLFPVLSATLGSAGLFTALAGVNVLQMVFARLFLPETRGLTLEEVQVRYYSSKRKNEESTAGDLGQETEPKDLRKIEDGCGDQNYAMNRWSTVIAQETTPEDASTENYKTDERQEKEGKLNVAYEDTETSDRSQKIIARTDEEEVGTEGDGQPRAAPATQPCHPDGGAVTERTR